MQSFLLVTKNVLWTFSLFLILVISFPFLSSSLISSNLFCLSGCGLTFSLFSFCLPAYPSLYVAVLWIVCPSFFLQITANTNNANTISIMLPPPIPVLAGGRKLDAQRRLKRYQKNRGQKTRLWGPWVIIACGIYVLIYLYIICNVNQKYILIFIYWLTSFELPSRVLVA